MPGFNRFNRYSSRPMYRQQPRTAAPAARAAVPNAAPAPTQMSRPAMGQVSQGAPRQQALQRAMQRY